MMSLIIANSPHFYCQVSCLFVNAAVIIIFVLLLLLGNSGQIYHRRLWPANFIRVLGWSKRRLSKGFSSRVSSSCCALLLVWKLSTNIVILLGLCFLFACCVNFGWLLACRWPTILLMGFFCVIFMRLHSHNLLDSKINTVLSMCQDTNLLNPVHGIIQSVVYHEESPPQYQPSYLQSTAKHCDIFHHKIFHVNMILQYEFLLEINEKETWWW